MNDHSHPRTPRHEKLRFRSAEISDLSAMPSAMAHRGHWRGERRRRHLARLALFAVVLVVLVAGAGVGAVAFLVTSDWGAETLRQQAERAVRSVAAGKAEASVGPSSIALGAGQGLGMRLTSVALTNPLSGSPIVEAGAVDFGVRLLPLLAGSLRIGGATISDARIDLGNLPSMQGDDWTAVVRDQRGLVDPDLVVREAFKPLYGLFDALDRNVIDDIALDDVDIVFMRDGRPQRLRIDRASLVSTGRDTLAIAATLDFEGRAITVGGSASRDSATRLLSGLDLRIEGGAPADPTEREGFRSAGRLGPFVASLTGSDAAEPKGAELKLSAAVESSVIDFGARGLLAGTLALDATLAEGSHKVEIGRLAITSARNAFEFNGAFGPRPATGRNGDSPAYRFEMVSDKAVLAAENAPEAPLEFGTRVAGIYDAEAGVISTSDMEVRTASGAILGNAQVTLVPGGAPGVALAVSLEDMPVAEAKQLWPWFSATKARQWVLEHLFGGRLAKAEVKMRVAPGRLGNGVPLSAEEITGSFEVVDTRFDTFGSLPPLRDASGTVEVRGRDVDVTLASGAAFLPSGRSVAARNGVLVFRNTAVQPVVGRLDLDLEGDAAAIAELASLPPISGPQRAGILADDLSGAVVAHVTSDVPLVKGVDPKSIDWKADLSFKDLAVTKPFGDQKLSAADGTLALLPDRATLAAKGLLNGVKATIALVEPLRPDGPKRERKVELLFDEAARKAVAPALNQLMTGTAKVQVDELDGKRRVSADLTDTKVDLPWVGWSKGAGVAASAEFTLASAEGTTRLSDFEFLGNSFSIAGDMTLSGGALSEAKFSRIRLNRGDSASASVVRSGKRYRVDVDGDAVDVRAIVKKYLTPAKGEGKRGAQPAVAVRARLGSAIGFNGEALSGVSFSFDGDGFKFAGTTGSGQPVSASNSADDTLRVESGDAGDLLRFLDLYGKVQGGSIKIVMAGDGQGTTRGQVDARNFVVVDEPRLASVVSTAPSGSDRSLSQAARKDIDVSRVQFERGYAQVEKGPNSLRLARGVLRGPEIGATFQGTMYDARGRIDMTGTFMPAYGVNRIFGEIPLFGELLGNGRDRGLIGVTFKLEGDAKAPRLQVNPLSVMAPGIFRQIFEFD